MLVKKALLEAAHLPWKLREARRRLFLLTTGAANGTLAVIETDGGLVCVIGLDDLVDIVMDPPPTLHDVMRNAGVKVTNKTCHFPEMTPRMESKPCPST
ncbi:hypothetical protein K9B32_13395 [Rhizobium sp. 3T7]|uniref:hypothetical protein n=1 Tax=Rhizobium sp. 3T7 TaxID=2874922 RepID=UPI001CCCA4C9|nr:hypothetical protein [Rhizobium sp. 3T7]MBZ9791109.1 hypothetical protein [Rhizobium sp. 3T7]